MDLVAVVRHKVLVEGASLRDVSRQLGLSRNTIRRYVRAKVVPTRRAMAPRGTAARDGVVRDAEAIWDDRRSFTAGKQRLTAQRLAELLHERGHTVRDRTVRRLVARLRRLAKEVTVPLVHPPGALGQVDFFEVVVEVRGVRVKAWMFLMRLLHSGRDFVMLCERQDTTWFLAAHVAAFGYFAGLIAALAYDNLTAAVAKVVLGEPRPLRPRFTQWVAHDAFEARFCRPGEGHDQGSVERRGGNIRLQHMVPIPKGESLAAISAALQARLDVQHGRDPDRVLAWQRERAAFRPLPLEVLDPAEVRPVSLRHHASHRVAGANYSVPSRGCGTDIEVRLGTDTVVFARGDEHVVHPRQPSGGRSVDYEHLLLPLSIKPQALRQVAGELVAQFGEPWEALWQALRVRHSPDEIEAARRFGPWLREAAHDGLSVVATRIRAALQEGRLVTLAEAPAPSAPRSTVPAAFRGYTVEGPDLSRYDMRTARRSLA